MSSWTTRTLAGFAVTAAAITFTAAPAGASTPHEHSSPASHSSPAKAPSLKVVKTLSSAFVGPLQFAVAGDRVYVADSFTSTLNLIGQSKPLATGPAPATGPGPGGDLAGVAVNASGHSVAYTTSNADHSSTKLTILKKGKKPVVADLSGFEKRVNPDQSITYGVNNPSQCVIDALTKAQAPVSYRGLVDSHPYAVASLGHGAWAVADAGGNDIVKVDRQGHVSLIKVLPAQPVTITQALATSMGLPACVVGITYKFEAVPTDVEVGPDGALYVSTLAGGGLAPGSVYKIDRHGKTVQLATGFAGATNLAIDSHGNIYVAQIGSGTIARIVNGKPQTVLTLPGVVAVEYANGHLYASTSIVAATVETPTPKTGPGTVVLLGRAH